MPTKIIIKDWTETPATVQEFTVPITDRSFSYDGGRLDIDGLGQTVWVIGHSFSVDFEEV